MSEKKELCTSDRYFTPGEVSIPAYEDSAYYKATNEQEIDRTFFRKTFCERDTPYTEEEFEKALDAAKTRKILQEDHSRYFKALEMAKDYFPLLHSYAKKYTDEYSKTHISEYPSNAVWVNSFYKKIATGQMGDEWIDSWANVKCKECKYGVPVMWCIPSSKVKLENRCGNAREGFGEYIEKCNFEPREWCPVTNYDHYFACSADVAPNLYKVLHNLVDSVEDFSTMSVEEIEEWLFQPYYRNEE